MKKLIIIISIIISIIIPYVFLSTASAYWVWTPETKKFVNPKYAVKDSPKEQFDWAMSFYNAKDYERAAVEFEKLTKSYEYSIYASRAQYHVGLCYENMGKYYTAFQNYQKAIDNFPHIDNIDEVIAREFNIGLIYANKDNAKVLGTEIMPPLDRSVEIYKKVVDNAPYGRLADEAQFRMGEALKQLERYDEAIQAFQKILDEYPASKFMDKAKYEVANCTYKASLKPAYDSELTQKAINQFQEFTQTNRDLELSKEADLTIQRLKDRAAEKSILSAKFYEEQGRYESAIIYYKDVIDRFPTSSFTGGARKKIEELKNKIKNLGEKPSLPNVVKELAKSWKSFKSKKDEKKKESSIVTTQEKPKSRIWNPFRFDKKKRPQEPKEKSSAETEIQEEKSKAWTPFRFDAKTGPKEEKAVLETKDHAPKAWVPLNFDKESKKEELPKEEVTSTQKESPKEEVAAPQKEPSKEEVAAPKEEPKPKAWKPFNFEKKKVAEEAVATPQGRPKSKAWKPFKFEKKEAKEEGKIAQQEAPKSKAWTPFRFDVKTGSKEEKAVLETKDHTPKAWTPLNFDKKPEREEPPVEKAEENVVSPKEKVVSSSN